jgi:hypothetical protein
MMDTANQPDDFCDPTAEHPAARVKFSAIELN